jgi:hypothetical protein
LFGRTTSSLNRVKAVEYFTRAWLDQGERCKFSCWNGVKTKTHAIPARKCYSRVGIGQPTYKLAQPGAQHIFDYQNHTIQNLSVNGFLASRDDGPPMYGTYVPVPNVTKSH